MAPQGPGASGNVQPPRGDKRELVRAQFGRQAAEYARSRSHAAGDDLGRLLERLPLGPGVRALDVATGTGNTAFALAAAGAAVTGLDLTPEMLEHARRQAAERGLAGVEFVEGDAERLPFPGGSFDVVTTRRAPHHFPSIPRFLTEARRVLRAGGALGVIDQCGSERAGAYELGERFEKLRDPSHVRALRPSEWHAAVVAAGFELQGLLVLAERMLLDDYLRVAGALGEPRAQILRLFESSDPTDVAANGLEWSDGRWWFTKRRVLLWAVAG